MKLLQTASELAPEYGCIFVPTMGALHDGHAALIRAACSLRDRQTSVPRPRVVVSVFVNRTQFNDAADYARYPKTLDRDAEISAAAGADAIFAPEPEGIYPLGEMVAVPPLPAVATQPGLEDALRPGHFAGVCQVVNRLFDLVRPAHAMFGEKDWQQLRVIDAMTKELKLAVTIHAVPTIRESDGLAMSSRNRFLTDAERKSAPAVYRALATAQTYRNSREAERAMQGVLAAAGFEVQYAVVRDAHTLLPVALAGGAGSGRALIACKLGTIRLIDNAPWPGRLAPASSLDH